MKIYTKTGDNKETSIVTKRILKCDLRVDSYGSIDEFMALIGISYNDVNDETKDLYEIVLHDLFVISSLLANPSSTDKVKEERIKFLESKIDEIQEHVKPFTKFMMPLYSPDAARINHLRTFCRKVERILVALSLQEDIDQNILVYFNRLSDLLYVLTRYTNKHEEMPFTY